jgi:hypothetical protein
MMTVDQMMEVLIEAMRHDAIRMRSEAGRMLVYADDMITIANGLEQSRRGGHEKVHTGDEAD